MITMLSRLTRVLSLTAMKLSPEDFVVQREHSERHIQPTDLTCRWRPLWPKLKHVILAVKITPDSPSP